MKSGNWAQTALLCAVLIAAANIFSANLYHQQRQHLPVVDDEEQSLLPARLSSTSTKLASLEKRIDANEQEIAKLQSGVAALRNMVDAKSAPELPVSSVATKLVAPVPASAKKKFFVDKTRQQNIASVIVAHEALGYERVDRMEEAHFVWRWLEDPRLSRRLQPWQRINHIPNTLLWDEKDLFVEGIAEYEARTGSDVQYLPKSYILYKDEGRQAFVDRLTNGDGNDRPWVLKASAVNGGKGITMVGPNTTLLEELGDSLSTNDSKYSDEANRYIVQEYVCNALLYQGRKFDLRAFFMVASLDPLIVLFHNGYLRAAGQTFDGSDYSDATKHVTNLYSGAEAMDWGVFDDLVRSHYEEHRGSLTHPQNVDPVMHVRNQLKSSVADIVHAFRDKSFIKDSSLSADNAFTNNGIDFFIDQDLNVFVLEAQRCPDHNSNHKRPIYAQTFVPMVKEVIEIVEEVQGKQSHGRPILPLEKIGGYEVVYENDTPFRYDFERPPSNGCQLGQ